MCAKVLLLCLRKIPTMDGRRDLIWCILFSFFFFFFYLFSNFASACTNSAMVRCLLHVCVVWNKVNISMIVLGNLIGSEFEAKDYFTCAGTCTRWMVKLLR